MKTLILNSSNIASTANNSLTYTFPSGAASFKGNKLALASISIYYSWDNVSSINNTLSYTWSDATVVQVTLPSGFYTVSDINAYLQSVMLSNNHYLIDSTGNYVYYLELIANGTYYSVQFNSYPIPTVLPSGWTKPGAWSLPTGSAKTPQLTIPSSNSFYKLIGINAGTYPSAVQSTNYSKLSDTTPQITPIQSIVLNV